MPKSKIEVLESIRVRDGGRPHISQCECQGELHCGQHFGPCTKITRNGTYCVNCRRARRIEILARKLTQTN